MIAVLEALVFVIAWIAVQALVDWNERLVDAAERPAVYVQAE